VNPILRSVAAVMIFLGTYVLAWLPGMMLPGEFLWVGSLVALGVAAGVAVYAWRLGPAGPRSVRTAVALGALLVGGAGFAAGFFGPMLLAPGANQGPMLGIFITGPLGYLVGAGLGLWYGLRREG
jgi:hypothetical protein